MDNYRVLKDFWYKGKFYQKDQLTSFKKPIAKHYLHLGYIKQATKTNKTSKKTVAKWVQWTL